MVGLAHKSGRVSPELLEGDELGSGFAKRHDLAVINQASVITRLEL